MPTKSRSCATASRKESSQNCISSHSADRSLPARKPLDAQGLRSLTNYGLEEIDARRVRRHARGAHERAAAVAKAGADAGLGAPDGRRARLAPRHALGE